MPIGLRVQPPPSTCTIGLARALGGQTLIIAKARAAARHGKRIALNLGRIGHTVPPVSYTHLDLYKRQADG